jgi:hypothetical protein
MNIHSVYFNVSIQPPGKTERHHYLMSVDAFTVIDKIDGTSARGDYASAGFPGVIRPLLLWTTNKQ